MRHFLFTALLIVFSFVSFGQLEDVKIESRNGQRVYVHVIQKGNTLWGLHKLYDVPVEKIVAGNPGVENGLQEGQIVYIPVPVVTQEKTHTVATGETLYSISRKYDVNVKDLTRWNPGSDQGIKEGQQLKIFNSTYVTGEKAEPAAAEQAKEPAANPVKITFNDSIVEHTVAQGETLYSISRRYLVPSEKIIAFNNKKNNNIKPGEVLKIPLKKERIAKVDVREVPDKETGKKVDNSLIFKKKDEYHVAIMLPFMLNKGAGYSEAISNMAAEFLMGAQMAIDSLEKAGLNAKVYVYDTENSPEKIRSILAKPELASMDLIIGPLNKSNAPLVADWCLEHKVRMVCPVNVDTKILQNNPYVYTTMGSDITLMKGLAKFMAQQFKGSKIVLIKPTTPQDSVLYQAFRSEYNRLAGAGATKLIETSPGNFSGYLSNSGRTALVFPTNDVKSATSFMNELSRYAHKFGSSSYVFGTDAWLDMDGINAFYRNKYRITVPTSMDLNYNYERTKIYHRKYRSLYQSDFTKVAIQGFDVMYNFCSELLLDKKAGQLIMNDFESIQIGPNHGFENQHTEILTHSEYELKNISNGLE
ncbi:LysM peptidoglycan-binding domain-containing protein [Crocinitomicaceae bacterium CZZ-1]|uniref:LysM peptidoglycan-binding domain-containing protein n=1 Tax=Taishania pollutisoli TaxID=2766479 RepID=A0A8J6PGV8_9FLAO|nr:LysM peptidoglycan-binding domain-containing protein [Taishania pollutisoli]MBC9811421.1 LysM peptidoglycan-binding domain-containing protein [Taishania pollutisoli]